MIDPVAAAIVRLAMAAVLLSAAWHKLRDVRAFRAALDGYALLPATMVPVVGALIMGVELVLGLALLLPDTGRHAAAGSALLLGIYSAAIAVNLGRGRTHVECGCAGSAGALPLRRALVFRNIALIVVSLGGVLPTTSRALHAGDLFLIATASATFALLYIAAETALANAARWPKAYT